MQADDGNHDRTPGRGEAVLDAVFNQSAVGLHVLDTELRVVRVNPVAIGMRGVPEESVIGRSAAEAYAPLGMTVDEEALRGVLATGQPVQDRLVPSHPLADPDHEHVLSESVYRLQDDAGARAPSGVYFVRVRMGGEQSQQRVIYLGQ